MEYKFKILTKLPKILKKYKERKKKTENSTQILKTTTKQNVYKPKVTLEQTHQERREVFDACFGTTIKLPKSKVKKKTTWEYMIFCSIYFE